MQHTELTDQVFWNDYWEKIALPVEIKKKKKDLQINEILHVFEQYLPDRKELSILEIGGAPGQYLAFMHKNFGYNIHCLDFSATGCQKTIENFRLLNIEADVIQRDLFKDNLNLPQFDIVYSLGFIEHFENLYEVISKHLNFLKPNGTLVLGVPNFLGLNRLFLKRLRPQMLKKHNLKTMDISNWESFEKEYNLNVIFKNYVGGFEPWVFNRNDNQSPINNMIYFFVRVLCFLFHSHFKFLKKINSKFISGYALGIYRT